MTDTRFTIPVAALCAAAVPAPAWAQAALSGASVLLPQDLSVRAMFLHADIVVQGVMVGLLFASVVTWTILVAKAVELAAAARAVRRATNGAETERTLTAGTSRLGQAGVAAATFCAAAALEMRLSYGSDPAGTKERIASRLQRIEVALARRATRGTGVLATIGSTAPFVGLFGTLWGIMNSFIGISQSHTTNLAVVAPGIAEALLATAAGLVAAIPAVVIYNLLARATGEYRSSRRSHCRRPCRLGLFPSGVRAHRPPGPPQPRWPRRRRQPSRPLRRHPDQPRLRLPAARRAVRPRQPHGPANSQPICCASGTIRPMPSGVA